MNRAFQLRLALFFALIAAGVALAATQNSQDVSSQDVSGRAEIDKIIKESGANVSVAARSLDNSQELLIRADERYDDIHALRIPIMIELYAEAEAGELKLSDALLVHDGVRVDADGPVYHMDHQADPTLTQTAGKTRTLRELNEDMITHNSDFATNLLIERLTLPRVRERIKSLGADGMVIAAPFPNNVKNFTSARAVMALLWALATEKAVSPGASKEMVGLIAHSGLHPSGPTLPPPVPAPPVAATALRDATILFGAHSMVFVIQVQGIRETSTGAQIIGKITTALAKGI
ncbi:MAG: serine hydrolase [Candidatus Acidiferrales bacterium]